TRENFIDSVFLTNHDQNRIMSEFSENEGKGKLASNILFTLPGISWIYYGEELGMTGEKPDESIRQPFKWSEDDQANTEAQSNGINDWNSHNQNLEGVEGQLDAEDSMLNHYRTLIQLKKDHEVLREGSIELVDTNSAQTLAYERKTDDASVVVVHNLTKNDKTVSLDMSLGETLYDHQGKASFEGDEIELEGRSSIVIETD
ncbi:MAG: alpha-amylase family glycosyl hydrolase, partial [Bacillota bacterium]